MLTVSSADLVLGNDDLCTIGVIRSGDGVLQETDGPDDFAHLYDSHLAIALGQEITWIADNLFRFHRLASAGDSNEFAIRVRDNGIDWLIQHVCATVYSAQASKRLG